MSVGAPDTPQQSDPRESIELLLRDLRSQRQGLSEREASRRLLTHGPNELRRRGAGSRRAAPGTRPAVRCDGGMTEHERGEPFRPRSRRAGGTRDGRRRGQPRRGMTSRAKRSAALWGMMSQSSPMRSTRSRTSSAMRLGSPTRT